MMRICSETDLGFSDPWVKRYSRSSIRDSSLSMTLFRPATVSSVMGAIVLWENGRTTREKLHKGQENGEGRSFSDRGGFREKMGERVEGRVDGTKIVGEGQNEGKNNECRSRVARASEVAPASPILHINRQCRARSGVGVVSKIGLFYAIRHGDLY